MGDNLILKRWFKTVNKSAGTKPTIVYTQKGENLSRLKGGEDVGAEITSKEPPPPPPNQPLHPEQG